MEVVALLRLLWRRRIPIAVGAVVAAAIAVTFGRSPGVSSGVAETRVVLDTPQSQLVTDDPRGAPTLAWRATLLAMLLGTDRVRAQLARETQISPDQLAVTDFELTAPSIPASLPRAAIEAANVTTEPYGLIVRTDGELPVVSMVTSAPDRAGAARLAQAAVRALQAGAPAQNTEELQGLTLQQAGPIEAREIPGGSGLVKMAALAVVLFGLWCTALIAGPLVAGIARTFSETRAAGF